MVLPARPSLTVLPFVLLLTAFLLIADNARFWRNLYDTVHFPIVKDWLHLVVVAGFLFFLLSLFIYAMSWPSLTKALAVVLLAAGATSAYFADHFGTMIDPTMIQNAMETDVNEAMDLMTWSLMVHLILYFLLPVALVFWLRIEHSPWKVAIRERAWYSVISVVLIAALVWSSYDYFASTFRSQRALKHYLAPVNVINAIHGYVRERYFKHIGKLAIIGTDAHLQATSGGRKNVIILVVGETARAQNFALNGYARNTTPELANRNGIYFSDVTACGTSTAISVPCMFAFKPEGDYSESKARETEGLLDIVQRAGVSVLWKDNNSGCKGVCARVTSINLVSNKTSPYCVDGECFDEILLEKLNEEITGAAGNQLIVLHQKGSHGPAYYRRVPSTFVRFTPECKTEQLSTCSSESIVNSYDNTIAYTDHFLARLIDLLAAQQKDINVAMLYVSDHGESLGENGLYLHGMPKMLAPEQQTKVPMYLWMSEGYAQQNRVNPSCVAQKRREPFSHDNVFHTVLGMTNVSTSLYAKSYDILAPCRNAPTTLANQ